MATEFEEIGFFIEYIVDGKFVGTKKSEADRTEIGYNGRRIEVLTEEIILDNKKKIKAGTTVKTLLYPLCGKLKK